MKTFIATSVLGREGALRHPRRVQQRRNASRFRIRKLSLSTWASASALAAAVLAPNMARACACGCGIFDVGTSSMLPQGPGGMVYLEYDYQNQYINWSGNSHAVFSNNSDRRIETDFVTAGLQYMYSRSWGIQVEVPYANRTFKTQTADPANPGGIASLTWGEMGDIRVKGIYTGFSEDLSTGITFGFKLPTGNYTHNDTFGDVDRDTEIGTGSTDLLLGGFHRQKFTSDSPFTWFAQAQLDLPLLIQEDYRPGWEVDGAAGVYYEGWSIGRLKISPVAQVLGSVRGSDSGEQSSNPVASGYRRILLSPGIEFDIHPVSIYADVEIPVFQQVTGNQLTAPALFKVVMSYHF